MALSVDELKTEIEHLTSKSIAEVIAHALEVKNNRDLAMKATLARQMEDADTNHLQAVDESGTKLGSD